MSKEFERLKKYLVDISDAQFKDQYTINANYYITYQNRSVSGFLNGQMSVENYYGSLEDNDMRYINWDAIKVFKRLKRW